MNYGEVIQDVNIQRENIYTLFARYFNNPKMFKIKNIKGYSLYACKVKCLLCIYTRYIMVFVNQDNTPISNEESLYDLKWESIQTRTLKEDYNLPIHEYQPTRNTELFSPIQRVEQNINSSNYASDKFPVFITLLNDKNGGSQYQDKGNIVSAIETYNTIISLKNV